MSESNQQEQAPESIDEVQVEATQSVRAQRYGLTDEQAEMLSLYL